jgi:hypothetical protein
MPVTWLKSDTFLVTKQGSRSALPNFLAFVVGNAIRPANLKMSPVLRRWKLQTVPGDFFPLIARSKELGSVPRTSAPSSQLAVVCPFRKNQITNLDEQYRAIRVRISETAETSAKIDVIRDRARNIVSQDEPASDLRLNAWLRDAEIPTWNEGDIDTRARRLMNEALKEWKHPGIA